MLENPSLQTQVIRVDQVDPSQPEKHFGNIPVPDGKSVSWTEYEEARNIVAEYKSYRAILWGRDSPWSECRPESCRRPWAR